MVAEEKGTKHFLGDIMLSLMFRMIVVTR
jgi:hypothetical protein